MVDTQVEPSAHSIFYNHVADPHWEVWSSPSVGFIFYTDASNNDMSVQKTTDSGATWTNTRFVGQDSRTFLAVWYDRWTPGDTGDRIHLAWADSGSNAVEYGYILTTDATPTLTGNVTALSGTSFVSSGGAYEQLGSICKTRGGNLLILYKGDSTGGEEGLLRSIDAGVNWTARGNPWETAGQDRAIIRPGAEADNQDAYIIYYDSSATELSYKHYDDSANSFPTETVIDASIVFGNISHEWFDAVVRDSDNHVFVAYWNDQDTATADFKSAEITNASTVTARGDITTNSDDSYGCALMINNQNDDLYVAYVGSDDGTQTFQALTQVFYKTSTNGAVSWSTENAYQEDAADDIRAISCPVAIDDAGGRWMPAYFNDDLDDILVNETNDVEIAAAGAGATSLVLPHRSYRNTLLRR